jgi:Family of unknown function (DUF695).
MSEEWDSYLCNVNDKLASIRVDLGIRSTVPDPNRPWLLWVWVYFEDQARTAFLVVKSSTNSYRWRIRSRPH